MEVKNQQNGRLVKNILGEAIINLSSRFSFQDDSASLVTLGDVDVIHGCRAFCGPTEPPYQDDIGSKSTKQK